MLLDGIPMAVAPYGQPQLSFAPVSLGNIETIDVVRSGGAVRYGPQNVGGIINFTTKPIPTGPGISGDASIRQNIYTEGGGSNTQYDAFVGTTLESGLGLDAAMRKVCDEMSGHAKVLTEEFNLANFQLQMGRPRREVLHDQLVNLLPG